MATTGVITKIKTTYATTEAEIDGLQGNSTSPIFLSEGLPWGSALVVVKSGTTPTSVTLQGSNDGINFVALGSPATGFPAVTALAASLAGSPLKFYNFLVTGGDGTTNISIFILLMGSHG